MNNLKLIAPALLVLLLGCTKPGLQGVLPLNTEIAKANVAIRSGPLSPSRYIASDRWRQTLNRVVEKIGASASRTCLKVSAQNCNEISKPISIVDDPTINAFVDAQNNIGVHGGLLTYASSDEEIAAVIAHEYGHIFAGHIERREENAGLGVLTGLLGGLAVVAVGGPNVIQEAGDAGQQIGFRVNSKEFELEADYYSALILRNSGIDLEHGRNLLIRIARMSQGHPEGGWTGDARLMATTHPADNYRIARWMGISSAIEDSNRFSGNPMALGYEEELTEWLREDAWDRLLSGPTVESHTTRWVNPENGHSGMFTVADVDYGRKCNLTCIRVSHVEDIQGQREQTDSGWICKIDDDEQWVYESSLSCVAELQIATSTISAEDRDHPEISADLSPNVTDEQPVSTGSAYVYVFRPGNDGNRSQEPPVMFTREGKDRTLLAIMDNGRFIKVELESGEYLFFSNHQTTPPVNLNLKAGGEYYLEMDSSRWNDNGTLLLATEEEALKEMKDLKPLDTKFVRDPRVIVP